MRKTLGIALIFAVAFSVSPVDGQVKRSDQFNQLMIDKLKNAQRLLEGMALHDFAKISDSAEQLIRISKSAEWFIHNSPRYEMHSNDFRRAAEVVVQKARDKNIDGVALGYVDLTLTCVRCHQHVREIRDARAPIGPSDSLTRK